MYEPDEVYEWPRKLLVNGPTAWVVKHRLNGVRVEGPAHDDPEEARRLAHEKLADHIANPPPRVDDYARLSEAQRKQLSQRERVLRQARQDRLIARHAAAFAYIDDPDNAAGTEGHMSKPSLDHVGQVTHIPYKHPASDPYR